MALLAIEAADVYPVLLTGKYRRRGSLYYGLRRVRFFLIVNPNNVQARSNVGWQTMGNMRKVLRAHEHLIGLGQCGRKIKPIKAFK